MGLDLNLIASQLASLEETLIYKLLDRAQFCLNAGAYEPGGSGFAPHEIGSLFELRLGHQENLDTLFGRYTIPEERPFHSNLPSPRRQPGILHPDLRVADLETVNVSGRILAAYQEFLKVLCPPGDDGNWGSSVEHDVICLQALGRRIHYGSFYVAESKFQENTEKYLSLILAKDEGGLLTSLTRSSVEEKILVRVKKKVKSIQKVSDPDLRNLVDPDLIVDFFEKTIIPLTKEGEILYLIQRV